MSREEYWQKQIQGWEESNHTQKNYCTENQLSYSQFIYWRNRLNKKSKLSKPSHEKNHDCKTTPPQWVPITIESSIPEHVLTLRINQLQLEFTKHSDPVWLRKVVDELSKVSPQ
ncbi:MAG TPA: hypothetical protein HPP65_00995 [Gammaproteobacteria bacterium]|jgi:hypothetical protein|nr:hypothetical protein [Gammaproteobacteria bacterium]MBT5235467.1 hypothetical protein [Candidatus Neomarinimicrobiota bacterium]MBT6880712.1 hypothetical protein [Gammaproteobacteria bacterium]HIJ32974.1 hypothetical protein [Gammaproteobacteria bacterium]